MPYTPVPCPPLPDTPSGPPTWTVPEDGAPETWTGATDGYFDAGLPADGQICEISTSPTIYYSDEILIADECPEGPENLITFIVPAFSFSSSVSQEIADGLAMTHAQQVLSGMREEFPCEGIFNFLELSDNDLFSLSNGQNLLLLI